MKTYDPTMSTTVPPSPLPHRTHRTLVAILRQLELVVRAPTPDAHLCGRVKEWSSTVAKGKRLGVDPALVLDRLGARIVVRQPRECYLVMDSLHATFGHVPAEYDDYVAAPKENGYRGLHSILVDAHGHPFEVQVRTRAMHALAQRGAASHEEYKRTQLLPDPLPDGAPS